MNTYTIYIGCNPIACVSDTQQAYACYNAALSIAEMTNRTASLVWDETGEEVASYDPEEVEEEESTNSCLHCPWCWIGEDEDYPRCHFEGAVAPCEEEDYYEDDDDLECGFDPYCGCFTDDCRGGATMAYPCDKCFHNFNCSLASVAACNCCEDGSWFESVRNTETEEEDEEPPPF